MNIALLNKVLLGEKKTLARPGFERCRRQAGAAPAQAPSSARAHAPLPSLPPFHFQGLPDSRVVLFI